MKKNNRIKAAICAFVMAASLAPSITGTTGTSIFGTNGITVSAASTNTAILESICYELNGRTAVVTGALYRNITLVKIPGEIKKNGITYKVTGVKDNAFNSYYGLTTVRFDGDKCVYKIGNSAFANCTNLANVYLRNNTFECNINAFKNTSKTLLFEGLIPAQESLASSMANQIVSSWNIQPLNNYGSYGTEDRKMDILLELFRKFRTTYSTMDTASNFGNPSSFFVKGNGDSLSLARAFCLCAIELNIPKSDLRVIDDGDRTGTPHAWVMVKYNNKWYHINPMHGTFARGTINTLSAIVKYDGLASENQQGHLFSDYWNVHSSIMTKNGSCTYKYFADTAELDCIPYGSYSVK